MSNRNHVGISLSNDFLYTMNALKGVHNCSSSELIRMLLKKEAELYNLPKHDSLIVKPKIGRPKANNDSRSTANTSPETTGGNH